MEVRREFWDRTIRPYVEGARRLTASVELAVICSTQGKTVPTSDYETQTIESRFYSLTEADHFLGSLRGAGFLVNAFFNERDFMSWVAQRKRDDNQRLLVISTGSSFSGVGAKSLIPAFCRLHGIEVVGPDSHLAGLARHKFHYSLILRTLGDHVPQMWCYDPQRGWIGDSPPPCGLRVILKLNYEGASIGISQESVTLADANLERKANLLARTFRQPVVVQEFVAGFEVEVPIFCSPRPRAIFPVGLSLNGVQRLEDRVLTYDITKADGYGFWDFEENEVHAESSQEICAIAVQSAELLGLRDLARIDFRVGDDGPKIIDVSTSPYISPHSSFAFLAAKCGGSASELPLLLVALAAERIGLVALSGLQPDLRVG